MTQLTKALFSAILVWVIATFAVYIPPHSFYGVRGFAFLLVPLFGLLLAIFSIVLIFVEKGKLKIIPLLAVLFVALFSVGVGYKGTSLGAKAHFFLFKSRYESMVAQIKSAKSEEEKKNICANDKCNFPLEIKMQNANEPSPVAFRYLSGFLFWQSIVYDPSGTVMKANSFDKRRELSIYLRETEHMSGDWYYCYFSD